MFVLVATGGIDSGTSGSWSAGVSVPLAAIVNCNAVFAAVCSPLTFTFESTEAQMIPAIVDAGSGFVPEAVLAAQESAGLSGMRGRATARRRPVS
jgi:hypothetical protein